MEGTCAHSPSSLSSSSFPTHASPNSSLSFFHSSHSSTICSLEIYLLLPPEILSHILSLLDPKSFCSVRTSSLLFFELTQKMKQSMNVLQWHQIRWAGKHIKELCESRPDIFVEHDLFIDSVTDLEAVCHEYLTEFEDPQPPQRTRRAQHFLQPTYEVLLSLLWKHMINTCVTIVDDIVKNRRIIADNFEILDFCLRRYIKELFYSFPPSNRQTTNEQPVFDTNSLEVWSEMFGDRELVPFGDFRSVMETVLDLSDRGKHYFAFCTNFPEDNIMTPYRFQILCHQFGPWSQLAENFEQLVCRPPFVGLLNATSARRFLRPDTFLLRFSRACPESLTLSYCHITRTGFVSFRHIRTQKQNIRETVQNLRSLRPSMRPVEYHFNGIEHASQGILSFVDSGYIFSIGL